MNHRWATASLGLSICGPRQGGLANVNGSAKPASPGVKADSMVERNIQILRLIELFNEARETVDRSYRFLLVLINLELVR